MGLNSHQREAGLFAEVSGKGEEVEQSAVQARQQRREEKPRVVRADAVSAEG